MAYETKDDALADAVKFLATIKRRACAARLTPSLKAEVTEESRCLSRIEGDVEEWLNDLAAEHSGWALPWKMTPEYAEDRGLEIAVARATAKPALPAEVTRWLRKAIGELKGRSGEAAIAAVSPRMLVGALLVAPTMEALETAITSRWGVSLVIASGNTVADVAAAIVAAMKRSAA